ncbi:hypothetical protein BH10PAT1_BH10PAT1_2420 [soil metagenome]
MSVEFGLKLPFDKLNYIPELVKEGKLEVLCICYEGIVRSNCDATNLIKYDIKAKYLEDGIQGIQESCVEKQNQFVDMVSQVPSIVISLDIDEVFENINLISRLDYIRDEPILFRCNLTDHEIISSIYQVRHRVK